MEFLDVRHNAGSSPLKPRISTAGGTVTICIPGALAEHLGCEAGKGVKVQFGQDDAGAAIRLRPEEGAPWVLRSKRRDIQLQVPELLPTAALADQDVEYADGDGALTLTLPRPWVLSNEVALRRPSGGRRAATRS